MMPSEPTGHGCMAEPSDYSGTYPSFKGHAQCRGLGGTRPASENAVSPAASSIRVAVDMGYEDVAAESTPWVRSLYAAVGIAKPYADTFTLLSEGGGLSLYQFLRLLMADLRQRYGCGHYLFSARAFRGTEVPEWEETESERAARLQYRDAVAAVAFIKEPGEEAELAAMRAVVSDYMGMSSDDEADDAKPASAAITDADFKTTTVALKLIACRYTARSRPEERSRTLKCAIVPHESTLVGKHRRYCRVDEDDGV